MSKRLKTSNNRVDYWNRFGILFLGSFILPLIIYIITRNIVLYGRLTFIFLGTMLIYTGYYGGFVLKLFPRFDFHDWGFPMKGKSAKDFGIIQIIVGITALFLGILI